MDKGQGPSLGTAPMLYPSPTLGVGQAQPGIQPANIMEKGQEFAPGTTSLPYPVPPVGVYQTQPGIQPTNIMEKGQEFAPGTTLLPYPVPPVGVYQTQPGIQPIQQSVYRYSTQQPQMVQHGNQVVMVQQLPTDVPGLMVCPRCQNTVLTKIEYRIGLLSWMMFGLLIMVWPFCFIPFCVNTCKDVKHSCPSCNSVLYIYKRG